MEDRTETNRSRDIIPNVPIPFMDRLTHSIVVETSKNLRQYIDVKRRENGFILNPSSTAVDTVPLRARFMYGTSKHYPPLYASVHNDIDVKNYLRSVRQHQRENFGASSELEKQVCRQELRYHMRTGKPISIENHSFSKLNLGSTRRSLSAFTGAPGRSSARDGLQSENYNNHLLVDDTANILAELVQARQKVNYMAKISRQGTPSYDSRNANPSPRQSDELEPESASETPTQPMASPESSAPSPKSLDPELRILAKMHKVQLITKSVLATYKITVVTGNVNGASTDAAVTIILYGKKGHTRTIELSRSKNHEVPFRKNQTDIFTIEEPHVGTFLGINIGHNEKDLRYNWYLSSVLIEDSIRQQSYQIECNAWLSNNSESKTTRRDFVYISKEHESITMKTEVHSTGSSSRTDYSSATFDRSIVSVHSSTIRQTESTGSQKKKPNKQKRRSSKATNNQKTDEINSVKDTSILSTPRCDQQTNLESPTSPNRNIHREYSPQIHRTPTPTNDHRDIKSSSRSSSPKNGQSKKETRFTSEPDSRSVSPSNRKIQNSSKVQNSYTDDFEKSDDESLTTRRSDRKSPGDITNKHSQKDSPYSEEDFFN